VDEHPFLSELYTKHEDFGMTRGKAVALQPCGQNNYCKYHKLSHEEERGECFRLILGQHAQCSSNLRSFFCKKYISICSCLSVEKWGDERVQREKSAEKGGKE
jgi:hypothetical protein